MIQRCWLINLTYGEGRHWRLKTKRTYITWKPWTTFKQHCVANHHHQSHLDDGTKFGWIHFESVLNKSSINNSNITFIEILDNPSTTKQRYLHEMSMIEATNGLTTFCDLLYYPYSKYPYYRQVCSLEASGCWSISTGTIVCRAQNIKCSFGCVARSAVLLKTNVVNILLFNFCEQKFVQPGPIMIAIDCNDLSLLIFEEKWSNYGSGPKSATNSNSSFWLRRLFNVCVRVFCAPNAIILLGFTYPPRSKWASYEKMIFILQYYHDFQSNVAIFPSIVQAYTQPYSFGGRIKLIICQIWHELSVSIHKISTS